MAKTVLFFGGNGHSRVRVARARFFLAEQGIALIEAEYPGFEGRERVESWEAFAEAVAEQAREVQADYWYGTGIGALIALALREEERFWGTPLLWQGAVLWGLKWRAFPKWMRRLPFAPPVILWLFRNSGFQSRFVGKYFRVPLSAEAHALFFEGYAKCRTFGDFFQWLNPLFLTRLEEKISMNPQMVANIGVWWGGQDAVVSLEELRTTERALQVTFPLRTFPEWGHYPMLDVPEEWARLVAAEITKDA